METLLTRDEALSALTSGSPHERLGGARFFAKHAKARDCTHLRNLRSQETDSYVIRTLDLAISRYTPSVQTMVMEDPADFTSEDVGKKARLAAIEWIAGLLLHEIASPVGLIAEAAPREIPHYATSRIRGHIERLQQIFLGIERLKNVSVTPRIEEFELYSWLALLISEEDLEATISISLEGGRDFFLSADPKLLRFAVCNGLRNAVEAVLTQQNIASHPVIVTWDQSDTDLWIAILDRGPGVVGSSFSAFEIGKTTKQGHSGFGLAIARQAMDSMDGTISLLPGREGGALYELRWPKA